FESKTESRSFKEVVVLVDIQAKRVYCLSTVSIYFRSIETDDVRQCKVYSNLVCQEVVCTDTTANTESINCWVFCRSTRRCVLRFCVLVVCIYFRISFET